MNSLTRHNDLTKEDKSLVKKCAAAGGVFHGELPNQSFLSPTIRNNFLIWFPGGCPSGKSTTVASSRLGKNLDNRPDWFDALRTLGVQLIDSNQFLITAESTTADRFVERISELFNIPTVDFKPFPKRVTDAWCQAQTLEAQTQQDQKQNAESKLAFTAWYKTLETPESDPGKNSTKAQGINDLLIGIAQSAFLLSVRNSGNIFKAVTQRLADGTNKGSITKLLVNSSLTPPNVTRTLLEKGATAWLLFGKDSEPEIMADQQITSVHLGESQNHARQPSEIPNIPDVESTGARLLSLNEIKTDQYLLHWTRRRNGPWPDQSSLEYLDDLIFQSSRSNHSPIDSLCRILATGKILGSSDITRDRRSVVCFSSVFVDQLPEKRIFRPHLSRWDFEVFGIAIDKDLLSTLGAKPVIYGDDAVWSEIPESDQPWFQIKKSRSGSVDWQSEKEWRLLGDLSLDRIPLDRAFLFVPSRSDAAVVAKLSHLPIVILDNDSKATNASSD